MRRAPLSIFLASNSMAIRYEPGTVDSRGFWTGLAYNVFCTDLASLVHEIGFPNHSFIHDHEDSSEALIQPLIFKATKCN